jgi:hypothetical protein
MSKRHIGAYAHTIGEVFRRPVFYRVPINQRDFAWTGEEIDVLWQDLLAALEDDRGEYFLGAFVISPSEHEPTDFEVVDGQQRLASLSMILAAIRDEWGGKDQAQEIANAFLGTRDRKSRSITPKLGLNATNDPIYQRVVLECEKLTPPEIRAEHKSNQLLIGAFGRFKTHLAEWLKGKVGDEREDALIALEQFVDRTVKVIVIEVGDESDAYIIFETLNDRGLELAVADLVKNYLFSLAGPRNIEVFKKQWTEISQLVGAENLTVFLRHYWISEYNLLRERDLYRNLRETIRDMPKAKAFLTRLRKVAELYAALLNPDHTYWSGIPDNPQKFVRALRLLRAAQYRPLALAVMEGGKADEVKSMLAMVLTVTYRYNITGASVNELERGYSDAAIAIRKSGKRNPKAVFAHLKSLYIGDAQFAEAFAANEFSKSDIARYTLGALNAKMETDGGLGISDEVTLEHILPRNPSNDWKFSAEEVREYVELVGNLTLLEKGTNKGIGNKNFKAKQSSAYSKSKLAINASLARKTEWTKSAIESRGAAFAKIALTVWRVDV